MTDSIKNLNTCIKTAISTANTVQYKFNLAMRDVFIDNLRRKFFCDEIVTQDFCDIFQGIAELPQLIDHLYLNNINANYIQEQIDSLSSLRDFVPSSNRRLIKTFWNNQPMYQQYLEQLIHELGQIHEILENPESTEKKEIKIQNDSESVFSY